MKHYSNTFGCRIIPFQIKKHLVLTISYSDSEMHLTKCYCSSLLILDTSHTMDMQWKKVYENLLFSRISFKDLSRMLQRARHTIVAITIIIILLVSHSHVQQKTEAGRR